MEKIKDYGTETMERIRIFFDNIQKATVKACQYAVILMISLKIDEMYCNSLTQFYGTEDYLFSHMRGALAITVSLIFCIIDLCLAYNIYIYAKKVKIIITFINGKFAGVEGILKIFLIPIALLFMTISSISLLYDVYEVVFVHMLGGVL